jgi:oligopeptidase B
MKEPEEDKNRVITNNTPNPKDFASEKTNKAIPKAIPEELVKENTFAQKKLKALQALQKDIITEITARTEQKEYSLPVLKNDFYYGRKFEREKKYPVFYRRPKDNKSRIQIIADLNKMAGNADYFDFDNFEISPDNRIMAYATDTEGEGNFRLRFKNLLYDTPLPEVIENCEGSMVWSADNNYLFYIINAPVTLRPFCLMRHKIGDNPKNDICLYREKDEAFSLTVSISKSGEYIFLETEGNNSNETWYLHAEKPLGKFNCFAERKKNLEYYIEHIPGGFAVLTNEHAKNFKLLKSTIGPKKESKTELLIPESSKYIDDFEVFRKFIVLKTRENALSGFLIFDLFSQKKHKISFDEEVFECNISDNEEFESTVFRFEYTSFTCPDTIWDYNMQNRENKLMYKKKVNTGFNPQNYIGRRLYAQAPDGKKIPISLVHKKDLKLNANNPLLIYGYGAYGENSEVSFSRSLISLLDRGFIYALAHVRGGSELGQDWYEDGKMMNKKNSFLDFIACTEYLHAQKYSKPKLTFAHGESAGGLLVGAVANMRPDLYNACVAEMPFVDVAATMSNKDLPLTVGEYEEWGNPENRQEYDYILSYSPVDRVKPQNYPDMLIISALNDSRVSYKEALKWTKKLRAANTGSSDIVLKVELNGGHFGPSDRPGQIAEISLVYAYLIRQAEKEKNIKSE